MNDEISGVCIGVCKLDENDVCIGCHRTSEEIEKNGKD